VSVITKILGDWSATEPTTSNPVMCQFDFDNVAILLCWNHARLTPLTTANRTKANFELRVFFSFECQQVF
jgi:hypothetical protein